MKERLRRFMQGRYGNDNLNRFLTVLCWVLLIAGLVLSFFESTSAAGSLLAILAWAPLVYSLFRSFSKNYSKRYGENQRYLALKGKVTGKLGGLKRRWKERKLYRFYRCPQCSVTVRVPKGKGKIRITCPRCGNAFIRKT